MESCIFAKHFWGDKHIGYDVMCQNLKSACRSTSDLYDFLRECSSIEDVVYRSLSKLAKQISSYSTINSFKPCWPILRQLVDQFNQKYISFVQDRQSLMKDVQKYLEEQQKRHKAVKESEASTQEVVHAFQATTLQLQKAREIYHARYTEYQRVMRNESSSSREQEKLEAKLKKAQDEYKYSVEKYNNLRNQFVSKMQTSCAQFQEIEEAHLEQMHEFLQRYASAWVTTRTTLDTLFTQFHEELGSLTTTKLLQLFVNERGTGTAEPQTVAFEDAEVAAAFSPNSAASAGLGVRAIDAFLGREPRVSSALAAVAADEKVNGEVSRDSLNDLSGDGVSTTSGSFNAVRIALSTGIATAAAGATKRRDGFFRRRRNSLTQDLGPNTASPLTPTNSNGGGPVTAMQSSSSLSAFNVVAKRGMRRLGTPLSNGKERKSGSRRDLKTGDVIPPSQMAKLSKGKAKPPLIRQSRCTSPETATTSEDWRTATPAENPKDEEGYSVRPYDPWQCTTGEEDAHSQTCEPSDSDSGSESEIDRVGRTFKGLQVNIRPIGELAIAVTPNMPVSQSATSVDSQLHPPVKSNMPILFDRRSGRSKSRRLSSTLIGTLQPSVTADLIKRLPTAPALPPPPMPSGSATVSGTSLLQRVTSLDINDRNSELPLRPTLISGASDTVDEGSTMDREHRRHRAPLDLSVFDPLSAQHVNDAVKPTSNWSKLLDSAADSNQRRCASAVPTFGEEGMMASPNAQSRLELAKPLADTERATWLNFNSDIGSSPPSSSSHERSSRAFVQQQPPWFTNQQESAFSNTNSPIPNKPMQPQPPARLTLQATSPINTPSTLSVTPNPLARRLSSPATYHQALVSSTTITPPLVDPTMTARHSFAAAFTETWRAQFYNGGGSSFSNTASLTPAPTHTVQGILTLAFPLIDAQWILMQETNVIADLTLRLDDATRLREVKSNLLGCLINPISQGVSNTTASPSNSSYMVTIPGRVLVAEFNNQLRPPDSTTSSTGKRESYVKLDVIHYTVDVDQLHPPIQLCTYWRCDRDIVDFRLDYTTDWSAVQSNSLSSPTVSGTSSEYLLVNLNVPGDVVRMQSRPAGEWLPESHRANWKLVLFPQNTTTNRGGTISARFILAKGPGQPQPVALQFFREQCLASGVRLALREPLVDDSNGSMPANHYQLGMCRRRLCADRYICDPPTRFHGTQPMAIRPGSALPRSDGHNRSEVSPYAIGSLEPTANL